MRAALLGASETVPSIETRTTEIERQVSDGAREREREREGGKEGGQGRKKPYAKIRLEKLYEGQL